MIGGNLILDRRGFTLWPTLVQWRTSSTDEKMTWHPKWKHFLQEFSDQRPSFLSSFKPPDKKLGF